MSASVSEPMQQRPSQPQHPVRQLVYALRLLPHRDRTQQGKPLRLVQLDRPRCTRNHEGIDQQGSSAELMHVLQQRLSLVPSDRHCSRPQLHPNAMGRPATHDSDPNGTAVLHRPFPAGAAGTSRASAMQSDVPNGPSGLVE